MIVGFTRAHPRLFLTPIYALHPRTPQPPDLTITFSSPTSLHTWSASCAVFTPPPRVSNPSCKHLGANALSQTSRPRKKNTRAECLTPRTGSWVDVSDYEPTTSLATVDPDAYVRASPSLPPTSPPWTSPPTDLGVRPAPRKKYKRTNILINNL